MRRSSSSAARSRGAPSLSSPRPPIKPQYRHSFRRLIAVKSSAGARLYVASLEGGGIRIRRRGEGAGKGKGTMEVVVMMVMRKKKSGKRGWENQNNEVERVRGCKGRKRDRKS